MGAVTRVHPAENGSVVADADQDTSPSDTTRPTPSDADSTETTTIATQQPTADEPVADQPAADEPGVDQPAADQPTEAQPTAEEADTAADIEAEPAPSDEPETDTPATATTNGARAGHDASAPAEDDADNDTSAEMAKGKKANSKSKKGKSKKAKGKKTKNKKTKNKAKSNKGTSDRNGEDSGTGKKGKATKAKEGDRDKDEKKKKAKAGTEIRKQAKRTGAGNASKAAGATRQELERIKRELDAAQVELERVRKELAGMHEREDREAALEPYQVELLKLQHSLEVNNSRMIVVFEGRDAAGKGGTIRRVTRYMNEKHYRVVALGKPTEEQRSQWYLQRYVREFPTGGEIVLFDRSWYNRAMVEPVFGFCTTKEYEDFLRGVVGFEKDLVRQDTVLVKLYFSVSKKEQQRRFDRRKNDPLRQWKLSEIDMQAQEHWDDFTNHKYEMLRRTHTSHTPWTVIRSESKPHARLNAMKVILNSIDYEDRNPDLDFVPDADLVLSGAHEVELMEAERLRRGKFRA